ncbi:hypothetical protein [Aquimarina longa]|uniref:hypothetical protein n=1 Tax=Aquimarina longa TaxID=1080221 RepID=UPI000781C4D9|nr:hypothetical protein [Aquimarina longa]
MLQYKDYFDDVYMIKYIHFLFIIISLQVFSQSETFRGVIVADSLQGYAINIVNFTKEIGATNDEKGFFEIRASVGDSIVFSSVQYQIRSIVITQPHLDKDNISIALYPIIQQLPKVRVSNIELSGNIDKDLTIVELQPFVDNEILGLPFSDKPQPRLVERRIYTAKSGILERPINYLNGKLKKLKRIKAIDDLNILVQQGEIAFDMSFFIDNLKLPKNLITDFMYYCAEDDYFKNLIQNSKKLALVEFFEKKAVSYKKHKEID